MDKKVFVFCIGGTGLRVMKSITMLMAAGADTNGYTVVPIIMDPHMKLEEKKDLQIRIDRYISIYRASIKHGEQKEDALKGFFCSEMKKLKELNNEKNDLNELGGKNETFGDFLGKGDILDSDINKYFIETLFSEKSLDNNLDVGFKGNPNVGTVVLGDMIEGADWFEAFKRHCAQDDRVFIISSIFGGTGASGYPLVEKKIRNDKDHPSVRECLMGALTVLPYYDLEDPATTGSDIDSANFITKAKSALSYYENTVSSNYLYYIGEQSKGQVYENNEEEQKDTAHFIELVGATALFDFLHREKPDTPQCLTRAIKDDKPVMDLESLGSPYKPLVKNVADYMLLKTLIDILPEERWFPLRKERGFNPDFYKSSDFLKLKEFSEDFANWYNELATNQRAFAPLNTDNVKSLAGWVKKNTLEAEDDSWYLLEMIKRSQEEKEETHDNKLRYFFKFAYEAINRFTSKIDA